MDEKTIVVLSNVTTGLVNFRNELLALLCNEYRVVVLAENTGRLDELKSLGCEFCEIKIDRHGTNPINEIQLIKRFKKAIRQYNPFVVLTYTIKPNIYGGLACSQLKIPYISNVTGLGDAIENGGILSSIAKVLYKVGLKNADYVFFQNRKNCSFFIEEKIYKGKYEILPGSGVNLVKNRFENYPSLEQGGDVVLSVIGRVTKDKGIDEILEASRAFENDRIKIQLIGECEGNYLAQLNEIEQYGVIKYYGRQENVHEWIKRSHAVLHASYHEGMSNVLLEAAACGRPIIATNIPGCAETFEEGVTGFGFAPKNTKSLIDAVYRFYGLSNSEKVKMGIAGRKKVEKEFDRNIVINSYITRIKSIQNRL